LQANTVTCYQKQYFYIHMHLQAFHSSKSTEANEVEPRLSDPWFGLDRLTLLFWMAGVGV
jgi:hypothetical protein